MLTALIIVCRLEVCGTAGYNDRFAFGHPKVMLPYGLRLRALLRFVETHPVHAETFLKWCLDQEQVVVQPAKIRFTRVRSSGEMWSVPQSSEQYEKFSDDLGHDWQSQVMKIQRSPLGFLEVVPCLEGCGTSGWFG